MTNKFLEEVKTEYENVVLDFDEVLNKVREKETEVEKEIKEFFEKGSDNKELVTS